MSRQKPNQGAGLGNYLKEAFLFRWNLLAFLSASAAALISPAPDVFLPLVAAGELLYLAFLTAVPRFRAAIDAKVHAQKRGSLVGRDRSQDPLKVLNDMLAGMSKETRERFLRLRHRCLYMQQIASGVRGKTGTDPGEADVLRTPALNKLLSVFVRLLFSQQALERFLSSTDESSIRRRLEDLKSREQAANEDKDERILRSLRDSIATAELRLDNYHKAKRNAEFVSIEIDRIEGKINAIGEITVSHQDPDYISSQVDSVVESMVHTEKAIREINVITGLGDEMQDPPPILETELE